MSQRQRSVVLLAALLGSFFVCLYLLTGSSDLLQNGDTKLRFQTAQAIVEHGRLWLDAPAYTDSRVAVGRGGHLYAFYGPGQAVLMIPLYIAGKVIAHHLSLPYDITTLYAARSLDLFLGAFLAVLFFLFALSAGFSRRVAVMLTLVFGAASVAWPDAQSGLEQTQVDLFLLIAALGTWLFVRAGFRDRRWLMLAGLGVGLGTLTRYDAGLYLPVFALYLAALRLRQGQARALLLDLAAYAAALLPCLLALAAWNYARFGSPFLTGLHEQTLGNPPLLGILELLISPGKGLLWYLPLLFLLPFATLPFWRRCPRLAALCLVLVLVPLIFYANVQYWHGDPSWGPRYLYVAVPYLLLPLGELFTRWRQFRVPFKAGIAGLIALSFLIQVSAVSVTQWRFWYRLQVSQQRTANLSTWRGQPFRWGASYYHYYWNVAESPILIQADDVYQVIRILLGDQRYRYSVKVDPFVSSNTAALYPVNTFDFWWADTLHPLLGARVRAALAVLLLAGGLLSLAGLAAATRAPGTAEPLAATERPWREASTI